MPNKMFPEEYKENTMIRILRLEECGKNDRLREFEKYNIESTDGTVSGELRLVRISGEHSS